MTNETITNTATLTREETAYHEAGHTVMACALGLSVEEVSIVPEPKEGSLGSSRLTTDAIEEQIARIDVDDSGRWTDLLRTVAGPMAQVLNDSDDPHAGAAPRIDWDDPSFGYDRDSVVTQCWSLPEQVESVLHEAETTACGILRARWDQVENLARALMMHETLNGEEVEDLLALAGGSGS